VSEEREVPDAVAHVVAGIPRVRVRFVSALDDLMSRRGGQHWKKGFVIGVTYMSFISGVLELQRKHKISSHSRRPNSRSTTHRVVKVKSELRGSKDEASEEGESCESDVASEHVEGRVSNRARSRKSTRAGEAVLELVLLLVCEVIRALLRETGAQQKERGARWSPGTERDGRAGRRAVLQ